MSGHSKWSTIKRAKGVKDAARGKLFSKLGRAITIAAQEGGGPSPDSNFKLRIAVEIARAANMPKENIDRAISRASGNGEQLTEVVYEGFGPAGVGIIIQATTDNKNRTAQEVKVLLDRNGGTFAGPGAVSFNFEQKGYLLVTTPTDVDSALLSLIDVGADDVIDTDEGIEVYVAPTELFAVKSKIEELGLTVTEARLIKKPLNFVELNEEQSEKLAHLLELIDEQDDVDDVFVNAQ